MASSTFGQMAEFYNGSDGFKDFGTGTPAMLHGIEAVVPKNDIGQLAKELMAFGSPVSENAKTQAVAQPQDNTPSNTEKHLQELIELNKNASRALNTLVTINAMTEKNTKNFNNRLANMGGSLV